MRIARIFKINTSYAIIIPPSLCRTLKWQFTDYITLEIYEKSILLSKIEFPPHVVKRLAEKKQRAYESLSEATAGS